MKLTDNDVFEYYARNHQYYIVRCYDIHTWLLYLPSLAVPKHNNNIDWVLVGGFNHINMPAKLMLGAQLSNYSIDKHF